MWNEPTTKEEFWKRKTRFRWRCSCGAHGKAVEKRWWATNYGNKHKRRAQPGETHNVEIRTEG